MQEPESVGSLEVQIEQWRKQFCLRPPSELDELERELRRHIAALLAVGLTPEEAFLVAAKRVQERTSASEPAIVAQGPWWQQPLRPLGPARAPSKSESEPLVALGLAVAVALAIKIPAFFGVDFDTNPDFYVRNASLLVMPFVASYLAWKRRRYHQDLLLLSAAFAAAALVMNLYPFARSGSTETLAALHLPIALWVVTGTVYTGGRWSEVPARMSFIRFTGELAIYYALIASGGIVLSALTAMIFRTVGIDAAPFLESWLIPCGAAGAAVIASWLAETRQELLKTIAPVLARLFTPFFTAVLLVFLGAVLWTGRGFDLQREVLMGFDLLLAVVLGLHLYTVSTRSPGTPPGPFDLLQVLLLASAVLADGLALVAVARRIAEFGLTPNRVAALGENGILLANLAGAAYFYGRFARGRQPFAPVERWQTSHLPVYAIWAAVVVAVFPPLFHYR